jgi:hypothetical protein
VGIARGLGPTFPGYSQSVSTPSCFLFRTTLLLIILFYKYDKIRASLLAFVQWSFFSVVLKNFSSNPPVGRPTVRRQSPKHVTWMARLKSISTKNHAYGFG